PAAGGVDTLNNLLAEYKTKGSTFRQHKQRVFKASYTNHYRRGLIGLLEALKFGSTNTAHAPVMAALDLIKRYKKDTTHATKYYAHGEHATTPLAALPVQLAQNPRHRRRPHPALLRPHLPHLT
ncbi:MAG: hypothetical protein ACRDSH_01550, partial [Pseudonocardiaceae bacterium]